MAASEDPGSKHWPTEIRYVGGERRLEIDFDNGVHFSYPAEYLRVESPSAEVQGHGPGQKQIVAGRRHVGIMAIEPVGNYAVRIRFDDLHDTGIFSWSYLYTLGEEQEERWASYLAALEQRGLSREPPRRH
ncbi:MAG: gamma-butyrobetaine hydroxylase-like domain-containing protein [Kiloniellales bacterium]